MAECLLFVLIVVILYGVLGPKTPRGYQGGKRSSRPRRPEGPGAGFNPRCITSPVPPAPVVSIEEAISEPGPLLGEVPSYERNHMTERGPITFFNPPEYEELRAPGGMCAPIAVSYAFPTNARPIRDAWAEMDKIARMSILEKHIYLLGQDRSVTWGEADIAARVCESFDVEFDEEVSGHEWDRPVYFSFVSDWWWASREVQPDA